MAQVINSKLDSLQRCLARIEAPSPDTMGKAFEALAELNIISEALSIRLRKAVGFRNLAVHSYDAIRWEIVFAIAREHLNDFRDFAKHIRQHV